MPPSAKDTTVPFHEGAASGGIMSGFDEDFLFRTQK
jgi:hypothetical protein